MLHVVLWAPGRGMYEQWPFLVSWMTCVNKVRYMYLYVHRGPVF